MSITAVGTFRVNPFPRLGPADPLGQMVGTGLVTGDASGGTETVSWSLPLENVYIVQAMGAQALTGSALTMIFSYSTGVIVDAIAEQYQLAIAPETQGFLRTATFIPPRFLSLPNSFGSVQLLVRMDNVLDRVLQCSFRALVFERNSFLTVRPADYVGFLGS